MHKELYWDRLMPKSGEKFINNSNGKEEISLWELSLGLEMSYPDCIKLIVKE